MEGLNNSFSRILLTIMAIFLLLGVSMIILGRIGFCICGIISIILGCLMMKGFREPDHTKSKKKWILTYFGKPTKETVDSMTLLLDWTPKPVVGIIEVDMNLVTHKYKAEKMLKCKGGYLNQEIVASFEADNTCNGLDLYKYISSGSEKNVIEQLNGILTVWMQWFANLKQLKIGGRIICKNITCDWMESNANVITDYILRRIAGEVGRDEENGENTTLDDISGLGIRIKKLSILLTAPEKVIEARNESNIQKARQIARDKNNRSMDAKLLRRAKLMDGEDARPNASHQEQILLEDLTVDDIGNVKAVVNKGGGVNVTKTT